MYFKLVLYIKTGYLCEILYSLSYNMRSKRSAQGLTKLDQITFVYNLLQSILINGHTKNVHLIIICKIDNSCMYPKNAFRLINYCSNKVHLCILCKTRFFVFKKVALFSVRKLTARKMLYCKDVRSHKQIQFSFYIKLIFYFKRSI